MFVAFLSFFFFLSLFGTHSASVRNEGEQKLCDSGNPIYFRMFIFDLEKYNNLICYIDLVKRMKREKKIQTFMRW